MSADRFRAYGVDGLVVADGKCKANGDAGFDAESKVAKVVFYSGSVEEESVSGSVEVSGTGAMTVAFPVEA